MFQKYFYLYNYSSYDRLVYVYWWHAHSRAVVLHNPHRGQRETIICTYLVSFDTLYYYLPFNSPGIFLFTPSHFLLTSSSASTAATTVSLAPTKYIPAWPHHSIPTRPPGVLYVSSHRSRSDRVSMNCATVFFLLRIYSSIALNTASSLAAAADMYSHFPSVRRHRSLPVNCTTTWSRNPPRTRPMGGGWPPRFLRRES